MQILQYCFIIFLFVNRNSICIEQYYLSIAQQTIYFKKLSDLAALVERANNVSII